MTDTRGNTLLDTHMSRTHVIHRYPAQERAPGKGMTLYIAHNKAGLCRFGGFHSELLLGWVECGNTQLGFIYVPPSSIARARDRQGVLVQITEAVAEKQRKGPVMIAGDWNAKLGWLNDSEAEPRSIPLVWQPGVLAHDVFGEEVVECTTRLGLKVATGRLDDGQPTWHRGRVDENEGDGWDGTIQRSRLDHLFIQDTAWSNVLDYKVVTDRMGSDHNAISTVIKVARGQAARGFGGKYRWDPRKKDEYVLQLYFGAGMDKLREAASAAERDEVAGAAEILLEAIERAATEVGMSTARADELRRESRGKRQGDLPLTREEKEHKRRIKQLIKEGRTVPRELRQAWRQAVRRAQRVRQEKFRTAMREHLYNHPRIFWKRYKAECGDSVSSSALFSTTAWTEHFKHYFRVVENRIEPASSGAGFLEEDCPLTGKFTATEVAAVCKKMGTGKAIGDDAVPIELYTKAKVPDYGGPQVMEVIAEIFNAVLRTGIFPTAWKNTHIVPLYKKGGATDMNNYRPIGVSTTLCRMFSGIMASRMSAYTHSHPAATRLQPSQFGFRPELSTDHAHLVLTTCVESALALGKPMALVRLDLSKAYDRVDREELWASMSRDNFPPKFIALMKELYRDTSYMVRVNGELGEAFRTLEGLLQGRGPSPGQFNTYERETIEEIDSECERMGIQFQSQVPVTCVQANWADDISCTVQVQDLAAFMEIVIRTLAKKKMQLNLQKCECIIIGDTTGMVLDLAGLKRVTESKVLGLWYCDTGLHTKTVSDRVQKGKSKNVLHVSRLTRGGCERDLELARLMVKVDIAPTLLFGAPIWGAVGLYHKDPMSHPLQQVMSVLPRFALGLPSKTAHWNVTNMAGILPVMHQILILFVRFWNRTMQVREWNPLVHGALSQQQYIYCTTDATCWMRQWVKVWSKVDRDRLVSYCIENMQDIDERRVEGILTNAWDRILDGYGNPFSIRPCEKRKIAFTHRVLGPHRVWGEIPVCVRVNWPVHLKVEWWRLLGGHIVVNFRGVQWLQELHFHERLCDRCGNGRVGDERHILLECELTRDLRREYRDRLRWARTLPTFIHLNFSERSMVQFVHECILLYSRWDPQGVRQ